MLSHVSHAQLKESDRVNAMLQLRKMGAKVEFDGNDMEFEGVQHLHGAELSSFNDHRILMALTVAGSTADGMTEISFPHAYRISYPAFHRAHERTRDPRGRDAAGAGQRQLVAVATAPATTQRVLDDLERWTARDPQGRAAVCVDSAGGDHVLTWEQLSVDSERLARRLRALGGRDGGSGRLSAPQPGRVPHHHARGVAPGRDLHAADADVPPA